MTDVNDAFLKKREQYGEDYSKTVKPSLDLHMQCVGYALQYSKLTVSYLFIINVGGLAGMLAIAPLIRDFNQVWLVQSLWIAFLFGAGLFFAAVTAAVVYLNFTMNARLYQVRATEDTNSLGIPQVLEQSDPPELVRGCDKLMVIPFRYSIVLISGDRGVHPVAVPCQGPIPTIPELFGEWLGPEPSLIGKLLPQSAHSLLNPPGQIDQCPMDMDGHESVRF